MGDLWQAIKRLALECLAANEQSDDLSSKALGWVVRVITLSGFGTFALGLSGSLNLTEIKSPATWWATAMCLLVALFVAGVRISKRLNVYEDEIYHDFVRAKPHVKAELIRAPGDPHWTLRGTICFANRGTKTIQYRIVDGHIIINDWHAPVYHAPQQSDGSISRESDAGKLFSIPIESLDNHVIAGQLWYEVEYGVHGGRRIHKQQVCVKLLIERKTEGMTYLVIDDEWGNRRDIFKSPNAPAVVDSNAFARASISPPSSEEQARSDSL